MEEIKTKGQGKQIVDPKGKVYHKNDAVKDVSGTNCTILYYSDTTITVVKKGKKRTFFPGALGLRIVNKD